MFWHHPLQTTLATLRLAWAIAQPQILAAGAPDLGAPDLAITAADEAAAAAGAGATVQIFRNLGSKDFGRGPDGR